VPELVFHFDEGIAHQARVEELIIEIKAKEAIEQATREAEDAAAKPPTTDWQEPGEPKE